MENKKNMSSNNSIKSDMEILIEKEVSRRVEENMKKRMDELDKTLEMQFENLRDVQKEVHKTENQIKNKLKELDRVQAQHIKQTAATEKQFEECSIELQKRSEAIENAVKDCSDDKMVSLNVGGIVFYTLKSTVSSISPFFANLFSDKWRDEKRKTIMDKDGNIFIDRSPNHFDELLNWSRNGGDLKELEWLITNIEHRPGSNEKKIQTFKKTLDYFGIDYNFESITETKLELNNKLSIYWRGDHRVYSGIIKGLYCDTIFQPNSKKNDIQISVEYEDGDIWHYQISKLRKSTGPYKDKVVTRNGTTTTTAQWWHYGCDKGATRMKKKKRPHTNMSAFFLDDLSTDGSDNDDDAADAADNHNPTPSHA